MSKPSNVVAFKRDPTQLSGRAQRTAALLGNEPMVTFAADESCCSVRLQKGVGPTFFGLVADKAAFTDRVRLAGGKLKASFVVHIDAHTPTVCGEATVCVLPVGDDDKDKDEDDVRIAAVDGLAARAPFGVEGQVLISFEPIALQVEEGEAPAHGAIPRT